MSDSINNIRVRQVSGSIPTSQWVHSRRARMKGAKKLSEWMKGRARWGVELLEPVGIRINELTSGELYWLQRAQRGDAILPRLEVRDTGVVPDEQTVPRPSSINDAVRFAYGYPNLSDAYVNHLMRRSPTVAIIGRAIFKAYRVIVDAPPPLRRHQSAELGTEARPPVKTSFQAGEYIAPHTFEGGADHILRVRKGRRDRREVNMDELYTSLFNDVGGFRFCS
ncbi:hypothetical protein [Lichen RNA virus 1]|nr:hypothetical protein [Lichen RNA virus 1]